MEMPILHRNGTAATSLVDEYCEAAISVTDAIAAIESNGPNQRDYYIVPGAWEKALEEHKARIAALVKVRGELQAIAEFCAGFEHA